MWQFTVVLAQDCMAHIYKFGQRDTEWLYIHLNVSVVIPAKSGISLLYREVVCVAIWVKNTLCGIFKLREAKSHIKCIDLVQNLFCSPATEGKAIKTINFIV